jgi:phosphatidylglycerol:prolipoprotein diacylglycerol transferase
MVFRTVPQSKWFPVTSPWVNKMMEKLHIKAAAGQDLINLPRHPSQIYEMLLEGLLLFIVLLLAVRLKNKPRGLIISLFFLGYGITRFFVEFFREPDIQVGYLAFGWLTMGMILCLPMIAIGASGIFISLKAGKRNGLWA